MARKFSLKDNPIFQRLEIPQPRSLDTSISVVEEREQGLPPSSGQHSEEIIDPQILTLKNRPSNFDPEIEGVALENVQALKLNSRQDEAKYKAEELNSLQSTQPKFASHGIFEPDKLVAVSEQKGNSVIFEDQNLTLKNRTSNILTSSESQHSAEP